MNISQYMQEENIKDISKLIYAPIMLKFNFFRVVVKEAANQKGMMKSGDKERLRKDWNMH